MCSENGINDRRWRSVSVKVELILVICLWPVLTVGGRLHRTHMTGARLPSPKGTVEFVLCAG
jgi:hypothetical protein